MVTSLLKLEGVNSRTSSELEYRAEAEDKATAKIAGKKEKKNNPRSIVTQRANIFIL